MRTITLCAALTLIAHSASAANDDIVFAPKNFADQGDVLVGISGTLTGPDMAYKNNTYAIACFKDRKECLISSIQQIGPNQIGRMDYPYSYPVVSWTAAQVVAAEEPSTFGCSRVTITITRKTETALWVEEPVNQSTPQCAKSDGSVRKYTVETSLGWKRLNGK
jgi:hypothetical protein